jgi:hypothetical protein
MPAISNNYFRAAVVFLVLGICLGIYMSTSGNHDFTGAHAHINLVGWATSAIFGGYFALNPAKAGGTLVRAQFWIFIIGAAVMCLSLLLLLGGNAAMVPVVAVSSLVTFLGVLLFAYIVWTPARS